MNTHGWNILIWIFNQPRRIENKLEEIRLSLDYIFITDSLRILSAFPPLSFASFSLTSLSIFLNVL